MLLADAPINISLELQNQFASNLFELRHHQPEVAAHIQSCPIPDTITPAIGRDGTHAFRISSPECPAAWFGGSSMPSISAPEILAEIPAAGGNVILPAIMTGQEALALLDRLSQSSAVFVIEHDTLNIALAMHLRDYTAAIRSGRLILIPFDMFSTALTALFERYPGFLLPTRMVTSPLLRQDAVTWIQNKVGEIAELIFDIQRQRIAKAQASWSNAPGHFAAPQPRIALIDAGGGRTIPGRIADLTTALAELGSPHVAVDANNPRQAHVAACACGIANLNAEMVLLINDAPGRFGTVLPNQIPTAAWFLSEAPLPENTAPNRWPQLIFASSRAQREKLIACGAPSDQVLICSDGLGNTDATDSSALLQHDQKVIPACLVVAPTIDDRPQSLNVTLPSHVRLWDHLRHAVAEASPSGSDVAHVSTLVRQGLRAVGMSADDDKVIAFFVQVFLERIAPAQHTRMALDALRSAEPAADLLPPDQFIHHARRLRTLERPFSNSLHENLPTPVVVLPYSFAAQIPCILEALAGASAVVVHGTADDWTWQHPDLAELLPALTFVPRTSKLPSTIHCARRILSSDRHAAAQRVRTAHTFARRLEFMVSALRQRLEQSPVPA